MERIPPCARPSRRSTRSCPSRSPSGTASSPSWGRRWPRSARPVRSSWSRSPSASTPTSWRRWVRWRAPACRSSASSRGPASRRSPWQTSSRGACGTVRLDAVVGIGGGSALDVAKAARIVADQGGQAADYASGTRTPEPPRIGLVLCPTTAGTGSEVSGASVLTDTAGDRKIGFGHPNMRAQHALVDPVLTHGLPPAPTAHSGVDAIAQAIGGCTVAELVAALRGVRARGLPARCRGRSARRSPTGATRTRDGASPARASSRGWR